MWVNKKQQKQHHQYIPHKPTNIYVLVLCCLLVVYSLHFVNKIKNTTINQTQNDYKTQKIHF